MGTVGEWQSVDKWEVYANGKINGATHPFHIHGMQFNVVYAGYGSYDQRNYDQFYGEENPDFPSHCSLSGCNESVMADFSARNRHFYNLVDPPLKDTVIVPAGATWC